MWYKAPYHGLRHQGGPRGACPHFSAKVVIFIQVLSKLSSLPPPLLTWPPHFCRCVAGLAYTFHAFIMLKTARPKLQKVKKLDYDIAVTSWRIIELWYDVIIIYGSSDAHLPICGKSQFLQLQSHWLCQKTSLKHVWPLPWQFLASTMR